MLKINLATPYPDWQNWVSKNKNKHWADFSKALNSNNERISNKTREYILKNQQDFLDGYTEMPITLSGSHIDHFKKKDSAFFPDLEFEWSNYVVSTTDEDFGGKYKDNKFKIQKVDYQLVFNPIEDDMSQYVDYENGEIVPRKEIPDVIISRVRKTIDVFNLNHKTLKNKRADLIKEINSCIDGGLGRQDILDAYSNQGFKTLIEYELELNNL